MGDFFVLRLHGVSTSGEKWVSTRVFTYGALGISEALGFRQPEGEEDVFVEIAEQRALDVYFSEPPGPELLKEISERYPSVQIEIRGEKNKDWLAEWKKSFMPFALTGQHWVVPSWCEPPTEARYAIRIDPGMAFGTGTHETTRLVAREIQKVIAEFDRPTSFLDVGTGTGILAILASQFGVPRVEATEIDVEARRVAIENFNLNQVSVAISERQVEDLSGTYDMVVANIIDGVLVRLQETLKSRVRPGGWLLVSGIIAEREQNFLDGFHLPEGVTWQIRRQDGDWLLYGARI